MQSLANKGQPSQASQAEPSQAKPSLLTTAYHGLPRLTTAYHGLFFTVSYCVLFGYTQFSVYAFLVSSEKPHIGRIAYMEKKNPLNFLIYLFSINAHKSRTFCTLYYNIQGKTHIPRIFFTIHNFRINGESHNSKPHKPRTKCNVAAAVQQILDLKLIAIFHDIVQNIFQTSNCLS